MGQNHTHSKFECNTEYEEIKCSCQEALKKVKKDQGKFQLN